MSADTELETRFSKLGGVFLTPIDVLKRRLKTIRGLVCDWDGVFNSGAKGEGIPSTFTEPDSMGTNLLRFALWRAPWHVAGRGIDHRCGQPVGARVCAARAFSRDLLR